MLCLICDEGLLNAFKILSWCLAFNRQYMSKDGSLSLTYLELFEPLGCVDYVFYQIWDLFGHHYSKLSFFPFLLQNSHVRVCWLVSKQVSDVLFFFLFFFLFHKLHNLSCPIFKFADSSAYSHVLLSLFSDLLISVTVPFNSRISIWSFKNNFYLAIDILY